MAVHLLSALAWPQVRDLASHASVAILPIGALEAHGPHLPVATDVVIAEAMAREGARQLAEKGLDVFVLPALPFTAAPFAAGFAGTVDVDAHAVVTLVAGIVRSLARHGVEITAIANAHFDPLHVSALRRAQAAMSTGPEGRIVFPDVTRRRLAERLTDEFRSGACHAGRYEGSIVLAERPEWVKADLMRQLPPNERSLVEASREGRETFEEAGGTEAYFGWPAEASAEEGRRIVHVLGEMLAEEVLHAMAHGDNDAGE